MTMETGEHTENRVGWLKMATRPTLSALLTPRPPSSRPHNEEDTGDRAHQNSRNQEDDGGRAQTDVVP